MPMRILVHGCMREGNNRHRKALALTEITLGGSTRSSMDSTRKATREENEKTLQYKSRQETLLDEELIEDKLTQLRPCKKYCVIPPKVGQ